MSWGRTQRASGSTRPAAVAGTFYPADAEELAAAVDRAVADAPRPKGVPAPKALIAPHAGYIYSGPVAGRAYALVAPLRGVVERVVLLGPAHRVPLDGMAVPAADRFDTPLGPVVVDDELRTRALALPGVTADDRPHLPEHSLEVHLPFIRRVLGDDVTVLPVVVGQAPTTQIAALLDALWGGPETLIVVSSDLSHYHDQATATVLDRRTADAILDGRAADVTPHDACGAHPVKGLLEVAARRGLGIDLIDLRTSGDTAGDLTRVVGYGAFAFSEDPL